MKKLEKLGYIEVRKGRKTEEFSVYANFRLNPIENNKRWINEKNKREEAVMKDKKR